MTRFSGESLSRENEGSRERGSERKIKQNDEGKEEENRRNIRTFFS